MQPWRKFYHEDFYRGNRNVEGIEPLSRYEIDSIDRRESEPEARPETQTQSMQPWRKFYHEDFYRGNRNVEGIEPLSRYESDSMSQSRSLTPLINVSFAT